MGEESPSDLQVIEVLDIPIEAYQIEHTGSEKNENPSHRIDDTEKKPDYRIAICQNGKFVLTFDTGKNKFCY